MFSRRLSNEIGLKKQEIFRGALINTRYKCKIRDVLLPNGLRVNLHWPDSLTGTPFYGDE